MIPDKSPGPWGRLDLLQGASQKQIVLSMPPDAASLWGDAVFPSWFPIGKAGTSNSGEVTSSYQTNSNQNQVHQDQVVTTSSQAFRHPFYDAKAQYQRAQISLIDQQFSALMSAQNIPNLATVFGNELASIDADVYRLQIAYLTFHCPKPENCVITGSGATAFSGSAMPFDFYMKFPI
jgi:hypothetical protein